MTRFLLVVLVVMAATPAWADDSAQEAVQLVAQAKVKYIGRAYLEAAKLYMDAYAKVKEPTLLFNVARSYEEAGELKEAQSMFELYLSVAPTSDDEGRNDAGQRLARIRAKQIGRAHV